MAEEAVLEMDEILEQVLAFAMDEAQQKLIELGSFEPFTIIVEGENMHIESFPGDDPEVIRASALEAVKTASSFATHYAYCYDGFIDTDAGTLDAIIVECAEREQEEAFAICLIYKEDGDTLTFEEGMAYVGAAEMFFDRAAVQSALDTEFEEAQRNIK